MAPDEMQILAHVKRALRWLALNPARNLEPDVHRLESLSNRQADTNLRTARSASLTGRSGRGRSLRVMARPRTGNAARSFPTQGRSCARWHTRPCLFRSD